MADAAAWRSVHIIGVGGIGMSALARILVGEGVRVTGSDTGESALIAALREEGVHITIGHAAENLSSDTDMVTYSTAIVTGKRRNPEYEKARELGIPLLHRSQVLAEIIRRRTVLAVTGTHGKTTTSSLLGWIMVTAGRDPLVLVGGECPDLGGNARPGQGDLAVVEADESDRSFLRMPATHAIITNIDVDHIDQYGSPEAIEAAFREYVASIPGIAVLGTDSARVRAMVGAARKPVTFATDTEADYWPSDVRTIAGGVRFSAHAPGGAVTELSLQHPGLHNVRNALAAFALATELGVPAEAIAKAARSFRGTSRRLEPMGTFHGAAVVDDYAHHPAEVEASIAAVRSATDGRLIAVFQPHLYTRTHYHLEAFAQAFDAADFAVLTEIYAARETPEFAPVTGSDLAARVSARLGPDRARFCPTLAEIPAVLEDMAGPGDTILLMGAGDIRSLSELLGTCEGGDGGT
jgi:UDP-N-acetylmuramate--alanine ligase